MGFMDVVAWCLFQVKIISYQLILVTHSPYAATDGSLLFFWVFFILHPSCRLTKSWASCHTFLYQLCSDDFSAYCIIFWKIHLSVLWSEILPIIDFTHIRLMCCFSIYWHFYLCLYTIKWKLPMPCISHLVSMLIRNSRAIMLFRLWKMDGDEMSVKEWCNCNP